MTVKRTVVVVGVVAAVLGFGVPAYAEPSFPEAVTYSVLHPDAALTGVNDTGCVPSSSHPEPVVLIHGFLENAYDNWASLAPVLVAEGYCVFALDYGAPEGVPFGGLGSIAEGATELAAFVDSVVDETGAPRVSIVGHSKGGVVPRYYVRFLGGVDRVSRIVALSPPNYPVPGPPTDDALVQLNSPTDTVPGVDYTVIVTRHDQVVPYEASLLRGAGARNVILQDLCPADTVEHTGISYDPVARQVVLNALEGTDPTAVYC